MAYTLSTPLIEELSSAGNNRVKVSLLSTLDNVDTVSNRPQRGRPNIFYRQTSEAADVWHRATATYSDDVWSATISDRGGGYQFAVGTQIASFYWVYSPPTPPIEGTTPAATFGTISIADTGVNHTDLTITSANATLYSRFYVRIAGRGVYRELEIALSEGETAVTQRIDGLFGGGRYILTVATTNTFDATNRARIIFRTASTKIPGVVNPDLFMAETQPLWRELTLPNLVLNTGTLPAGYAESKHFAEGARGQIRRIIQHLTARCFGVVFENSFGEWSIVRREFLPTLPISATLTVKDFDIVDRTDRPHSA